MKKARYLEKRVPRRGLYSMVAGAGLGLASLAGGFLGIARNDVYAQGVTRVQEVESFDTTPAKSMIYETPERWSVSNGNLVISYSGTGRNSYFKDYTEFNDKMIDFAKQNAMVEIEATKDVWRTSDSVGIVIAGDPVSGKHYVFELDLINPYTNELGFSIVEYEPNLSTTHFLSLNEKNHVERNLRQPFAQGKPMLLAIRFSNSNYTDSKGRKITEGWNTFGGYKDGANEYWFKTDFKVISNDGSVVRDINMDVPNLSGFVGVYTVDSSPNEPSTVYIHKFTLEYDDISNGGGAGERVRENLLEKMLKKNSNGKGAGENYIPPVFKRGDVNQDGTIDISDAITTLGYLFLGNTDIPCSDSADADNDDNLNIADPVGLLNELFMGEEVTSPVSGKVYMGRLGLDVEQKRIHDYLQEGNAIYDLDCERGQAELLPDEYWQGKGK